MQGRRRRKRARTRTSCSTIVVGAMQELRSKLEGLLQWKSGLGFTICGTYVCRYSSSIVPIAIMSYKDSYEVFRQGPILYICILYVYFRTLRITHLYACIHLLFPSHVATGFRTLASLYCYYLYTYVCTHIDPYKVNNPKKTAANNSPDRYRARVRT